MQERLQKYMARCGVASRRKCEEIILQQVVYINDELVTELGAKVDSEKDVVKCNGKTITPEENKVYIIMNKPEDVITSVKDEKDRTTVIDLIDVKERIYPIGRLDYDTSGLLLLTNDGEIYNKIIHPRVNINKVYVALVDGIFTEDEMFEFEEGIDIGDYVTSESAIKILNTYSNNCEVQITIHEGKNRQVKRMCEYFNHNVISLKRIQVGEFTLDNLEKGDFRYLTEKELNYLKSL